MTMRINHIQTVAEFRKMRESVNSQDGTITKVLIFEDYECNVFSVNVRDVNMFDTCNELVKGGEYVLHLSLMTGTSRNGNAYEMLFPYNSDFVSVA